MPADAVMRWPGLVFVCVRASLGTMAAAGIGGPRDAAMAEDCLLSAAADDANATCAAVLYRLAQLHLTPLAADEPADVGLVCLRHSALHSFSSSCFVLCRCSACWRHAAGAVDAFLFCPRAFL